MQKQRYGRSIDWYDRLEELKTIKEGGKVHQRMSEYGKLHFQAVADAQSWTTCACGNMCDIIPRDEWGAPLDDELRTLGVLFPTYIHGEQYDAAINTLDKIEKRSATLIKRELAKEH